TRLIRMQTSQNGTSTPQSPRTVASEQPPDPSSLRQALVQTFPKPAKPEPNRLKYTQETRGAGGEVEAAADGALPRAPRRGALLLRPDHRHRHAARGLLCEGDDGVSFCAADPGLRLSAICRTAS